MDENLNRNNSPFFYQPTDQFNIKNCENNNSSNDINNNSTINTSNSVNINKNSLLSLDELTIKSTENLDRNFKFINNDKSFKINNKNSFLTLNNKPIFIKDEFKDNDYLKFDPKSFKEFEENYEIVRLLYSCQLAPTKIYEGIAKDSKKCVAIKETIIDQLDTFHKEFLKNELVIAHYMSKITHSVVIVYDYFHIENKYVLVMEYSDRPNFFYELLEDVSEIYLKYVRPIEDMKAIKIIAYDILNALDELHKRGIIHCDIKPFNFLLFNNTGHSDESFDENIEVKLTDFGLCHFIDESTGKSHMKLACGTHNFKAPEVDNVS